MFEHNILWKNGGQRMKKIIGVIMAAFMLFAAVGCSTEGLNLYGEMKKVSAWEAQEAKGNVTASIKMSGEDIKISGEFSSFVNTKDKQGYIEMKLNPVESARTKVDFQLSPVKMYLDNQTIYISKSYFTDLIKISGEPMPAALQDIKDEFIGINTAVDGKEVKVDQEAALKLFEKLFVNSKVNMPITQKGREYTIELDSNQMTDVTIALAKEILNNIDEINKISNTGTTQKEIDAKKAEIEKMLEQGKVMVKPAIDGSKMTAQYTFEDDKYKESVNAALKVKVDKETMTMDVTATSESLKAAKKAITLPTSKKVYTMEQLMTL